MRTTEGLCSVRGQPPSDRNGRPPGHGVATGPGSSISIMLESYLNKLLLERFGRYIDGLDAQNLQVAAWRGEVRLEGLSLRADAFEALDFPVELQWGVLRRRSEEAPTAPLEHQRGTFVGNKIL